MRLIRVERSLRLEDVAQRAGCTKGHLSKIEQGKSSPSIAVIFRVAAALGIEPSLLLDNKATTIADPRATVHVTPATRLQVMNEGAGPGYTYMALAAARHRKAMEPFILTVRPEQVDPNKTFEHPGEELIFVIDGEMEYRVGAETFRLAAGDSLYFDATKPHAPLPIGGPVTFLAVFCAPPPRSHALRPEPIAHTAEPVASAELNH
jgi:transcriptional regulator with XRE-family HTH domain